MQTHELSLRAPDAEHEAVLTLPDERGLFPAIMLIHGGGCTDVDCSVGPNAFPWSKHLAERLAEQGIAFLRYHRAPSDSLDGDLQAAEAGWHALTSHPAIDKQRCVILGHSEGSWQATLFVSKVRQNPEWIQPGLIIETGIFGGELMATLEAVFRAVDEPLLRIAESQQSVHPDALAQYAEAWHLELNELVDDKREVSTLKLRKYRQSVLDEIQDMLPGNKRFRSWLGVPTNAEAILDIADLPIALIVGGRDQETPPQQAQMVFSALENGRPDHTATLHSLPDHNHYLTRLSDDPLDTGFGPISDQSIALIVRLVHAH